MSSPFGSLTLMNLDGEGDFVFSPFPSSIETSARVNWQPQDVTIGVKPLFYANREPRQIRFGDLWLDNTETGDSITPDIEQLYELMQETEKGRPPTLLAAWGDRQERCVLEEMTVEEQFFLGDGTPIRARVSITLLQFQEEQARPAPNRKASTDTTPSGQVAGGNVFGPQP